MIHQKRTRKVASLAGQIAHQNCHFTNHRTDIKLTFAEAHTVNILFASSYANKTSSPTLSWLRVLIALPRCMTASIADR